MADSGDRRGVIVRDNFVRSPFCSAAIAILGRRLALVPGNVGSCDWSGSGWDAGLGGPLFLPAVNRTLCDVGVERKLLRDSASTGQNSDWRHRRLFRGDPGEFDAGADTRLARQ